MPTNTVRSYDMAVGKKGGGKHWTAEQVAARKIAEQQMGGGKVRRPRMPEWLSEEAQVVWRKVVRDMAGLNILDRVDEDVLASYCDVTAHIREIGQELTARKKADAKGDRSIYVSKNSTGGYGVDPLIKAQQSYVQQQLSLAEKLGLTASSRARLAKKVADGMTGGKGGPNGDLFGD